VALESREVARRGYMLPATMPASGGGGRGVTSLFKSVDITPTLWRLRAERSPAAAAYRRETMVSPLDFTMVLLGFTCTF
jgi:hypothetical protein